MPKRMEARADSGIAKLSRARRLLAECQSIDDAKNIRDQAEAVRAYCKQQSAGLDAQNYAAEIKLRAERKAGELLAGMVKHNGARDGKTGFHDETPLLSELGITKTQSHRWQTEASITEQEFDAYLRATHEGGKEITSSALYKLGKKLAASQTHKPTISIYGGSQKVRDLGDLAGRQFGCIYADPPWKYGNQATRAATSDHYPTLSVDELCEWPVKDIAAEDAHLHLWTTNAFLPESFRVIAAWGFEYRSCFVWVKPQIGIGNYWRVSHEFLLLGIRGSASGYPISSIRARKTRKSRQKYIGDANSFAKSTRDSHRWSCGTSRRAGCN